MKKKGHDCTGRPTKFNVDETPDIARRIMSEGKTLGDLAELLRVDRNTISTWMRLHPAFSAAVAMGKEDSLDKIERALGERAMGFRHGSEEIRMHEGKVIRVKTTTQYPPDVNAAKFVLTNKRSKEWAERQSVEHAVSTDLRKIILESLAPSSEPSAPATAPTEEPGPPIAP